MSDAKLRRLREFVARQVSGFQKKRMEAGYRDAHANATCPHCGGTGKMHYVTMEQLRGDAPATPPRRETIEEEIARLYGQDGPR